MKNIRIKSANIKRQSAAENESEQIVFVYMLLIIMICGCAKTDGELSENGQKDNSSKNSVSIENRVSEIEDDTSIITATTGETVQENAKNQKRNRSFQMSTRLSW